ncbi:hypothetical protein NDU88_006465 [Pleurodeles waltl]|uniref:Uncharacterized protein n=1 Tax=Pleurodeles waltl TaxID=8319 RepID=A0AAV7TX91_PLEWA|nr:hypothetical protein NDU88_006465 [Pleurodeles waltl]
MALPDGVSSETKVKKDAAGGESVDLLQEDPSSTNPITRCREQAPLACLLQPLQVALATGDLHQNGSFPVGQHGAGKEFLSAFGLFQAQPEPQARCSPGAQIIAKGPRGLEALKSPHVSEQPLSQGCQLDVSQ